MRKKLIGGILVLLFGTLLWYLFLKPHDYQVNFKVKASPGIINQSIKLWADGFESSKFITQKDWQHFTHQLKFNDSTHTYEWYVKTLNDSISQVKVFVTDTANSFSNKLAIPFSETNFEKRTKETVKDLRSVLKEHIERFKVTIVGLEEIQPKYCAYVSFKSKQTEKALQMMKTYSYLNSTMTENSFQLDGPPFIEIVNWNKQQDSITFNFCYPILKPDSLPKIEGIFFKKIQGRKAIKSIYNGNYITSDRAWYTMLEYASKNNLAIEETPIEIFYNNPNMGGDELKWKAEVFMPLKE
ncbi:GyrI-like domain-containing protein [Maribacter sp. 2308TA10-17]|uniref:GyrI-like domain-containing protein n=1 Tax=Maribacter sp. 2308TA10-17 TaxID=3386276 RepID=UPI0039BC6155